MTLRVAGTWLGVLVGSSTLLAGMIASLTYIFATKQEMVQVRQTQIEATTDTKLRDFRIQRLEVQVQNVENIAQRTDKNVEQLLLLRKMQPGPKPEVRPLPQLPAPDKLKVLELHHGRP